MTAKATTQFFGKLEAFESEVKVKLKELRAVADRENPALARCALKLAWLDELEELGESVLTYIELSRSASRLEQVVPSLENTADALEMALARAEALATERYGYEPDNSFIGRKHSERENRPAESNLDRIPTSSPTTVQTPMKESARLNKHVPSVVKTPKYSCITAEPPTPRLEDLGLSAASMNMLRRKF